MDAESIFVENLIENVQNQRCLYDKNDGFYYNRSVKERAWDEVADKCSKSAADCKHRWKLLRERFVKEMKKAEVSSGIAKHQWKFQQPLMFLKDSLVPRRTRDNVDDQEVELSLDNSVFSGDSLEDAKILSAPAKKKQKTSLDSICQKFEASIEKLEKSCSSTTEANPLDDAFLNIVSCLMKELTEPVKEEFQACMLQELYRLRRENKYH